MYLPKHFEEPRIEVLHQLLQERPLATLVTMGRSGPDANQIPLLLEQEASAPLGVLRGHIARANPLWQEHPTEMLVLVIFQGAESYISPSWYATKQETGRVAPTWNYVVVHARGTLRVIEDTQWLRGQIEALTRQQESAFAQPWNVADAPDDYIEKSLRAIVGIEIIITELRGKWKTSQNQPLANREGVAQALTMLGTDEAITMAQIVQSDNPSGS